MGQLILRNGIKSWPTVGGLDQVQKEISFFLKHGPGRMEWFHCVQFVPVALSLFYSTNSPPLKLHQPTSHRCYRDRQTEARWASELQQEQQQLESCFLVLLCGHVYCEHCISTTSNDPHSGHDVSVHCPQCQQDTRAVVVRPDDATFAVCCLSVWI